MSAEDQLQDKEKNRFKIPRNGPG